MTGVESGVIAPLPMEKFAALEAAPGIIHTFLGRVAGLDVQVDRAQALQRLDSFHRTAREELGLDKRHVIVGEQVHGREIAIVDERTPAPVAGVDGLITASPDVCLGVYVADCCAVYLAEPEKRVIGLLHSGRKGSELGITTAAIERMRTEFKCDPAKIVVQLSPCIRPPLFEIDFAALIVAQARAAGVTQVHDCGICTGANPDRYYSYRMERGKTGRMLALLALRS
ncbi:MAG: polyphenol oxidase family protein [Chthoniobacter sp.]|uniref:polyphenol oxidase family protein n=1 Tax=Chthoniobacter sp. TaxID=2510640 RepID=UPI0032A69E50